MLVGELIHVMILNLFVWVGKVVTTLKASMNAILHK